MVQRGRSLLRVQEVRRAKQIEYKGCSWEINLWMCAVGGLDSSLLRCDSSFSLQADMVLLRIVIPFGLDNCDYILEKSKSFRPQ